MVISGSDHLQWPPYGELGTRRPKTEKEMDMEQAFDEAMWEWTLEQGPPQDGDVRWLKLHSQAAILRTLKDNIALLGIGRSSWNPERLMAKFMEGLVQL